MPYFQITLPPPQTSEVRAADHCATARFSGVGMLCFALLPIVLADPAQVPNLTGDLSGVRHVRRVDLEGADSPL